MPDDIFLGADGGETVLIDGTCYRRVGADPTPPDSVLVDGFYEDCSPCQAFLNGGSSTGSGSGIDGRPVRFVYAKCILPREDTGSGSDAGSSAISDTFCTEESRRLIQSLATTPTTVHCGKSIQDAVANLSAGPQSVTISWSMVPAKVPIANSGQLFSLQNTELWIQDLWYNYEYGSGLGVPGLTPTDHEEIITEAFVLWKNMLESVFSPSNGYPNQLTVVMDGLGMEAGKPPPIRLRGHTYDKPSGINPFAHGDPYIRVGMLRFFIQEKDAPYLANTSIGHTDNRDFIDVTPSSTGTFVGDIQINAFYRFRRSFALTPNLVASAPFAGLPVAHELLSVIVHEIGHAFGIDHWDPRALFTWPEDIIRTLEITDQDTINTIIQGETDPGSFWHNVTSNRLSVMSAPGQAITYNMETLPPAATLRYVLFQNGWINNPVDRCMVRAAFDPLPPL